MPEPIMWAQFAEAQRHGKPVRRPNPETGELEVVVDPETGEPVLEKFPQVGYVGALNQPNDEPARMRIRGWVRVLKHDGHEINQKLTNAAAQDNLNASYVHFMRAKARHYGWFPVGKCPLVALAAQEIQSSQIVAKDILKDRACAAGTSNEVRPCKHYLAERDARRARHAKNEAKRLKALRSDDEKAADVAAKQTVDIVTGVGDTIASAIGTLAARLEPEKGKKG